jgi:ankyrin repeat protein
MGGFLRRVFGGSDERPPDKGNDTFLGLRDQALSTRRADVEIPEPPRDAPVWGVLMETGYEGATATLLALADGTTSLYISSGGGVIGGESHDSVRESNATMLRSANQFRTQMKPTSNFPLPSVGHVVFYALTDAGVLMAAAGKDDLGENRHTLSPLFYAGHEVISALRQISEGTEPDAGGDVNRVLDETGLTMLMVAAHEGREEILDQLIQGGANLEARDESGYTALMFACNAGKNGCVTRLLAARADVNARDKDGSTPLMFAAQHGNNAIVTLLLQAGGDPNAAGTHGLSALGFAKQNGHDETLRLLTRGKG